jgi:Pentapeptide repeats (8 copies)
VVTLELVADCAGCSGLCCVAPGFAASAEFAIDKPPGQPCPHLTADARCGIHTELRWRGFAGCATYDCFGAGQRVTRLYAERSWRDGPATAGAVFAAFTAMRQLHELLCYLTEALAMAVPPALAARLRGSYDDIAALAAADGDAVAATEPAALRLSVGAVLQDVSDHVRHGVRPDPPDHRGADLTAADLRTTDLRAATLRGASLLGADLRGVDLTAADLLGTDLRAAGLAGADLTGCLFLTQAQLDAARGDDTTTAPPRLRRPRHWPR